MLPSETMIWKPEFTDKTLSRKPGAVHNSRITMGIDGSLYNTQRRYTRSAVSKITEAFLFFGRCE
ncbi:hypothetical protein GRW71_05915 [Escherichia coli]|nr:hypothetical protein [Escherichia coli]